MCKSQYTDYTDLYINTNFTDESQYTDGKVTRRQGDKETRGQGDTGTGKPGDGVGYVDNVGIFHIIIIG